MMMLFAVPHESACGPKRLGPSFTAAWRLSKVLRTKQGETMTPPAGPRLAL